MRTIGILMALMLSASACGRSPRVAPPASATGSRPPSAPVLPPAPDAGSGTAPTSPQPSLTPVLFEEGEASWYGDPYHGQRAASGEVFDKNELTAAHRTLAFDTWVRVENRLNGRTVDVRINDRGPFVAGRVIDLSEAAARELDMIRAGVAPVRVSLLEPSGPGPEAEPASEAGRSEGSDIFYVVQLGAFSVEQNAANLVRQLAPRYTGIYVEPPSEGSALYRVLIGRARLTDAERVQEDLRSAEGIEAILVQVAD